MPYKDKSKDREWHKKHMRKVRSGSNNGCNYPKTRHVTPEIINKIDLDDEGNEILRYE